jgi:hypothetical protein
MRFYSLFIGAFLAFAIGMPTAFSQITWYYSAGDSTIYAQYPDFEHNFTYRFRSHGVVIEQVTDPTPGYIVSSSRTTGNVLAFRFWTSDYLLSEDYGETWSLRNGPFTPNGQIGWGRAGEQENLSWLACRDFYGWVFHSTDGWQTYDSTYANIQDSIDFIDFSAQDGIIYGHNWHDQYIYVSSDTGHTWSIGSPDPFQRDYLLKAGVPDELWGFRPTVNGYLTYLLSDTGRTVDTIFVPNLPSRIYDWEYAVLPTDEPGEIYAVADWVSWSPYVEFIIYHITGYGAQVDSFYYFCDNFEVPHSVQLPALPQEFHVQAFPNPFNSNITLLWESLPGRTSSIRITDLLGRRVWEWTGTDSGINWAAQSNQGNSLASGKYWVTILSGRSYQTIPILLTR